MFVCGRRCVYAYVPQTCFYFKMWIKCGADTSEDVYMCSVIVPFLHFELEVQALN